MSHLSSPVVPSLSLPGPAHSGHPTPASPSARAGHADPPGGPDQPDVVDPGDHRRLGAGLFCFADPVGPGLPLWLPDGAWLRHELSEYSWRLHMSAGYQPVSTPHVAKEDLFAVSGHLATYSEAMFAPMRRDHVTYYPKPMNCPGHALIFAHQLRSYRELPLRLFELGQVYRWEPSGTLHGLARVRSLVQDDAHLFIRPEDLDAEIAVVLGLVRAVLDDFGFASFDAELSTRPEKFIGDRADWDRAESALRAGLQQAGIGYRVAEGEGAFYAPKIDVHLADRGGRSWQCSSLQVDLALPERFDLSYLDASGRPCRPCMLHRALFGSLERFTSILLEATGGALPAWLCATQVQVLPVGPDHAGYAHQVVASLHASGVRAVVAAEGSLSRRVAAASSDRTPFVAVVGSSELAAGEVSVRERGGDRWPSLPLAEVAAKLAGACRPPR